MLEVRNYGRVDLAPYDRTGAARFDDDVLEYRRGATICGSLSYADETGQPSPMLCICTAPRMAWIEGETAPWETCIIFDGRAGARTASRVARWLLRGDGAEPVLIEGAICIDAGAEHMKLPLWLALADEVPSLFPWQHTAITDTRPRPVVGRGDREARPVVDARRFARAGRAAPDGGR